MAPKEQGMTEIDIGRYDRTANIFRPPVGTEPLIRPPLHRSVAFFNRGFSQPEACQPLFMSGLCRRFGFGAATWRCTFVVAVSSQSAGSALSARA